MKYVIIFLLAMIFASCNNGNTPKNNDSNKTVVTNDTIPTIRRDVSPNPVASFSKPIPNSLNNWHFAVNVYETKETFRYLVQLEYMELKETDTLKIPNIGIQPKVEIRPGKEDYSCIIGFFDRENNFKEYKLVTAKDNDLKVTVLHHYGVATYQSK
jgi:hypothetical protein